MTKQKDVIKKEIVIWICPHCGFEIRDINDTIQVECYCHSKIIECPDCDGQIRVKGYGWYFEPLPV